MTALPLLSSYKRIVIKVGSALLVDRDAAAIKQVWLTALCADIAALAVRGADVVIVSSGAIALGRSYLGFDAGPLSLEASQAAAAVGQIDLARAWRAGLAAHDLIAAQVLLTFDDTEQRRRYLNARATLGTLLAHKAIPVINENDTVATSEIRYGDNDRLAARVAGIVEADALVLLSDIDGLYTAPPHKNPDAQHIAVVEHITPDIEAMAGGAASFFSRGGMITKIEAARMATASGCAMVIAHGGVQGPLSALEAGARCTWFLAPLSPVQARKKWIAGTMAPAGTVRVDAGAALALAQGKSLLPAGVTALEGDFGKGDIVRIVGPDGHELARGLSAYDVGEAQQIIGHKTDKIAAMLGQPFRTELVHRNDLVMMTS